MAEDLERERRRKRGAGSSATVTRRPGTPTLRPAPLPLQEVTSGPRCQLHPGQRGSSDEGSLSRSPFDGEQQSNGSGQVACGCKGDMRGSRA